MKNKILFILLICVSLLIGLINGMLITFYHPQLFSTDLFSPFIQEKLVNKNYPLNQYRFSQLLNRPYQTSPITITKLVKTEASYTNYLFTYQTMGKKMTGSLNIPNDKMPKDGWPVIIMVRGYAEPETYYSGYGTKNAATKFTQAGYVTLAPDFFGFAGSDADFTDTWEARFVKPINVIELIKSVQQLAQLEFGAEMTSDTAPITLNPQKLGLWAHSNGGQISLFSLEILGEKIPTTLWAPVTAPFPYSILYFTIDNPDEGKEARAWVSMLEENYDVFEFSLTRHLDRLIAPIQLHHGTADQDAPLAWSENFLKLVEGENQQRQEAKNALKTATPAGANSATTRFNLEPIELKFYSYPNANHNLQPGWEQAMQRDLEFFAKEFEKY